MSYPTIGTPVSINALGRLQLLIVKADPLTRELYTHALNLEATTSKRRTMAQMRWFSVDHTARRAKKTYPRFRVVRAKLPSLAFSIHPSSILQTASTPSEDEGRRRRTRTIKQGAKQTQTLG